MKNFARSFFSGLLIISVFLLLLDVRGWLPVDRPVPLPTLSPSASPLPSTGLTLDDFYAQEVKWSSCRGHGGWICAAFQVPLDYSNPTAGQLTLAVTRRPSANNKGVLIMNPGGPGGSGIDYAFAAKYVLSSDLSSNFELVGFDPRGVGQSSPIDCLTDPLTDMYLAADGSPDDDKEIAILQHAVKAMADGCLAQGSLATHMGTTNAAKDIDILRAILRVEKINWFGKSYGTLLGATYARLFPTRINHMLLDGAMAPQLTMEELSRGQALGFEQALGRYATWCIDQANCPLTAGGAAGAAQVGELLTEIDAQPLPLADGRLLTQALATLAVAGTLYDRESGWPQLSQILAAAQQGDGEPMAQIVDQYTDRAATGEFLSNANEAIVAVNCMDHSDRPTATDAQKLATKWSAEAPVFGAYLAWGVVGCADWPAATPPTYAPYTGVQPILVIGTKYDPATPYDWAAKLSTSLGNAVELTWEGDGHTAYRRGSDCIDSAVDSYFIAGKVPLAGTACAE